MNPRTLLIVAAAAGLLGGCGISGNLRSNPGYAAFDSPGWSDTDREMAISLGPLPLRLARAIVDEDDPETAELLRELKAVRVYIYRIDGDASRVERRMASTAERLRRKGWAPLVSVHESGERVRVLLRADRPDRIRGMVVMVQDDSEVVLVNLIGDLRAERFNAYLQGLEIDSPRVEVDSG